MGFTDPQSPSQRRLAYLLAAALCIPITALQAQDASGRIVGIVTDAQGAAVPNARVTAVNTATNARRDANTDQSGAYQILQVPIGPYSVTVEAQGFRKVTTSPTQLRINESLRADVALEVGTLAETVTIESASTGVETVNATYGNSVTTRPIIDLPLNGRNVLQLAALQPGVVMLSILAIPEQEITASPEAGTTQ